MITTALEYNSKGVLLWTTRVDSGSMFKVMEYVYNHKHEDTVRIFVLNDETEQCLDLAIKED